MIRRDTVLPTGPARAAVPGREAASPTGPARATVTR